MPNGFIRSLLLLAAISFNAAAGELAGVHVDDEIQAANNEKLVLNGMGLREKLWIDVYVGSLYLGNKAGNSAEVLSQTGALRLQLDVVYKEFSLKKLLKAFRDGFEKNQSAQKLEALQPRIERFYAFFTDSAKMGDQYLFDYIPGQGTQVRKNGELLGTIEGVDFKNALIEIWLGNYPADKGLKKGLLGH